MNAEEMAKEIQKELKTFAKFEASELKGIEKKAARMGVKRLKQTSPKRRGDYGKNWTQKTQVDRPTKTEIVIHNKERYNITHLLEDGHVGVAHGRRFGRVRGIPHIEKVEKEVVNYIEKELGRRL